MAARSMRKGLTEYSRRDNNGWGSRQTSSASLLSAVSILVNKQLHFFVGKRALICWTQPTGVLSSVRYMCWPLAPNMPMLLLLKFLTAHSSPCTHVVLPRDTLMLLRYTRALTWPVKYGVVKLAPPSLPPMLFHNHSAWVQTVCTKTNAFHQHNVRETR